MFSSKVDAYIDNAPLVYRESLFAFRTLIHELDLNIEEDIKWKVPCFSKNGLVCSVAYFKNHMAINFFKGVDLIAVDALFENEPNSGAAMRTVRFTDFSELNQEILTNAIVQAVELNDMPSKSKSPKQASEITIPDWLDALLADYPVQRGNLESLTFAQKKEYVEYICSAKQEATRLKRFDKAMDILQNKLPLYHKYLSR